MKTTRAIIEDISIVKRVEVNGADIKYIERGTGEPVVFIHGAVSDHRTWLAQIEELSAGYRAISYSRRYHGTSAGGNGAADYSRAAQTADLIGFLEALELEKAHLVGHSYGASIALMAAIERPELVGSLILGEPSPFPELFDDDGLPLLDDQRAAFDEALHLAENGRPEAGVRWFLKTVVGVDALGLLPDESRSVVLDNAGTLAPMLRTYFDSPPSVDCLRFRGIEVPTLLITGELSPPVARLSNRMIDRCLPDSRMAVLKGASHGLQIENPAGFNRLIVDFLAETR
ncbi:MAG: alpha/beta hydrolase [Pyrinomonadaceae bacterium]